MLFDSIPFRFDSIPYRFDSIPFRLDSIRFDSIRFDSIRFPSDSIRVPSDLIRFPSVSIRFDSIRFDSIRFVFWRPGPFFCTVFRVQHYAASCLSEIISKGMIPGPWRPGPSLRTHVGIRILPRRRAGLIRDKERSGSPKYDN